MEKMEEKSKVKVKMKAKEEDTVEDNSLEEGIPDVPSLQQFLGK